MNDSQSARQQIVEKIKSSSNILVTVGKDPTVDELSAALGLTIMLNGLKKHATAVVSENIPPAIEFLEPGKTFENTVDSLRDFIIALDKEKADHLRYKVEGDVVKIFITPYRTTISQDDLDFSQGDYNVELVLALGVKDESHLDKALEAHGRILHDATVATLTCGDETSDLGSVAWHDGSASSVSEMLVALSEALKGDKPLLDEQTSTAFLTGIVSATDRFSNNKTSSKVMTMAAQLMAAGANQQLIAAKLSEAHAITVKSGDSVSANSDGTNDLDEGQSTKLEHSDAKSAAPAAEDKQPDGSLNIAHEPQGNLDEVAKEVQQEDAEEATKEAEDALAERLSDVAPAAVGAAPTLADLQSDIASQNAAVEQAADTEPTLGGTLNATTEQAADDKRTEAEDQQNHTILNHSSSALSSNDTPTFTPPPFGASSTPQETASSEPLSSTLPPLAPLTPSFDTPQATEPAQAAAPTLAEIDSANRGVTPPPPHDDALAAVHAAFDAAPIVEPPQAPVATPAPQPAEQGAPQSNLPPLPDFSQLPPPPAPPVAPFAPQTQDENLGNIFPSPSSAPLPPPPAPNDPGQFKIPGQS